MTKEHRGDEISELVRRQRRYYADSAPSYDQFHGGDREHDIGLSYLAALGSVVKAKTVLDVGCGTGRGVGRLQELGYDAIGVEPVGQMLGEAVARHSLSKRVLIQASGDQLPFPSESFDLVCALGVMHHAADPERVVSEMTRVARNAVFISDNNRFAHGPIATRLAKLALYKTGLWRLAYRMRTRGRGFRESIDDGVYSSYSVFDSFHALSRWADRVVLVPTDDGVKPTWFHPLLNSFHVMLCGVRDADLYPN